MTNRGSHKRSKNHEQGRQWGKHLLAAFVLALGTTVSIAYGRNDRDERTPQPRVLSISPTSGAQNVGWSTKITVRFTGSLTTASEMPSISPSIAGHWEQYPSEHTVVFRPDESLTPGTTYTIDIPEARRGDIGLGHINSSTTTQFTVVLPSVTRLQQLLAELDYLPVAFIPQGATVESGLDETPTSASLIPLGAQEGTFAWRFANTPQQLRSLFRPGDWSVLDEGAVMAFELEHHLKVDGIPGPNVWSTLLHAVATRELDPSPYNYVLASEQLPERLEVWSDGTIGFSSLVNTGATGAPTPLGTWAIHLRLVSSTMSGTNPDGVHYVDPDVPDVAFFYGSDAVHGFLRASYGFPQSNGCIELPLTAAKTVYGLDPIGTLVTVTSRPLSE